MDASKTYAYICEIPSEYMPCEVFPSERNNEIIKTKNEKQKAEKYFAWRLLEYAISRLLDKSIEEISFKKGDSGKWSADGFDFSLSHSNGVVAVAISAHRVGIDIEEVSIPKSKSFASRILTDVETDELSALDDVEREEYLIKKWTQKEAIFKSRNLSVFSPKKTTKENGEYLKTELLELGGKRYFCSVCALSDCAKIELVDL